MMQEAIKKVYDTFGIDAKNISRILQLEEEDIVQDRCSTEDEKRLHSLINGFSIMEYQVSDDAILHAVIKEFLEQYDISIQSLAHMIHVDDMFLKDFYEGKSVPLEIKYTISCQLFRLGNAVFPLDNRHSGQ